jgi:hypothetical protein
VERTDSLLLPQVLSNRLSHPPPAWQFRSAKKAFRQLLTTAVGHIEDGYSLSRSDVEAFYPSIPADKLETHYPVWGCDPIAVTALAERVRAWAPIGIPVGPEAFGVLGNAYLLPVDLRFAAMLNIRFMRWVDDVWIFTKNKPDRDSALTAFDEELDLLHIARSIAKTKHASGYAESMELARDSMLASLGFCLSNFSEDIVSMSLQEAYDEQLRDAQRPPLRRFRFIIKALWFRQDAYAVEDLLAKPALMNVDPVLSADYVMSLGSHAHLKEAFVIVETYKRAPNDEMDALVLHLLRALSKRRWGDGEGDLLLELLDSPIPAPVRGWAAVALANTSRWSKSLVKERVLEESETAVRRGLLSTLKVHAQDYDLTPFLRHIRKFAPDLFSMACWIPESPSR